MELSAWRDSHESTACQNVHNAPVHGFCLRSQATSIVVLISSDAAAYQGALEGFKETTRHRIVGVQILKENLAT